MAQQYANEQPPGYSNYVQNVAVVGAGGNCGKHIVDALLKNGKHKVTALTREESKSTIPEGVETRKVNYDDQDTLVAALRGQDALVITLGVTALGNHAKLVEAAAVAGVPWVLPNEFGYETDDMTGASRRERREHIESLGKSSWIGVACGFWYEYCIPAGQFTGFDVVNRTASLLDTCDKKIDMISWPQTGRLVANALALKIHPDNEADKDTPTLSQFKNKFIHGRSFSISQNDVFDSIMRVTGTTRDDWKISTQPVTERHANGMEMIKKGDRMGFGITLYSRAFFPDEAGRHPSIENSILGLVEEDIDQYTKTAIRMAEDGFFEKMMGGRSS